MPDSSTAPASQRVDRMLLRADDRAIDAFNRRRDHLRGVDPSGLPEDNERSDLLAEGFRYGADHGRAEAVAVRAAERARIRAGVEALRDQFDGFNLFADAATANAAQLGAQEFAADVLALIDGGETRGGDDE